MTIPPLFCQINTLDNNVCCSTLKSDDLLPIATREKTFAQLVQNVNKCHACSRMSGRSRVLSSANGDLQAKLFFVAEAPGRLGAEVSRIPLHGDQTGRNFNLLLEKAGIQREAVFITNAILCNPQDEQGRNSTPTAQEVCNCANHLKSTLEVVKPAIVVTLGSVALKSLNIISPHSACLSRDVGQCLPWNGRQLVPLYHPGPRARLHRSLQLQIEDFQKLALLLQK